MPIYEYACRQCGKHLEVLQKFSDPPLTDCECGGEGTLEKQISAAAFHLKGTGWYVTDFRDKGKKKKEADSKETSGDTPAGGESPKSTSGESPASESGGSSRLAEAAD